MDGREKVIVFVLLLITMLTAMYSVSLNINAQGKLQIMQDMVQQIDYQQRVHELELIEAQTALEDILTTPVKAPADPVLRRDPLRCDDPTEFNPNAMRYLYAETLLVVAESCDRNNDAEGVREYLSKAMLEFYLSTYLSPDMELRIYGLYKKYFKEKEQTE